jgi:predicted metal-dependent hydrolase
MSLLRREWASCSSQGYLAPASHLLHLPRTLVGYVICYHSLRLRVPDHGEGFQAMMNAHMPDWTERERDPAKCSVTIIPRSAMQEDPRCV